MMKRKNSETKLPSSSISFSLFLGLLLSLFLLTACGSAPVQNRPLYSGSDGIIMSFPSSNALRYFEDERFTISVKLLNDGTSDITKDNPGYVTAAFDASVLQAQQVASSSIDVKQPTITTGYAPGSSGSQNLINGIQTLLTGSSSGTSGSSAGTIEPSAVQAVFTSRGRSIDYPTGDVAFVEFTLDAHKLPANRQKATTPFTLQVCYPYTTTFIADVCVDSNVMRETSSASCTASALTAQPQGAPIAVRTVTPRYTRLEDGRMEARFELEIENLHDGFVLWPGANAQSSEVCNLEKLDRTQFGYAEVRASISGTIINCGFDSTGAQTPEGVVRFDKKKARAICRVDESGGSQTIVRTANYLAPLIVQVRYFYIQSQSSQLEVNK